MDTLLNEVVHALDVLKWMSIEVLWLSNVPTPLDVSHKKSGVRNIFMKEAAAEYTRLKIMEAGLPNIAFVDVFAIMRARADETCMPNNNHYLCAWDRPLGHVGYWALSQIILSYVCAASESN